jgi:hypothetical protein
MLTWLAKSSSVSTMYVNSVTVSWFSMRPFVIISANMEAQRRLQIISGHLVPHGASRPDVLALQRLLDHDNIELRARMKDFFKDELYVPR